MLRGQEVVVPYASPGPFSIADGPGPLFKAAGVGGRVRVPSAQGPGRYLLLYSPGPIAFRPRVQRPGRGPLRGLRSFGQPFYGMLYVDFWGFVSCDTVTYLCY